MTKLFSVSHALHGDPERVIASSAEEAIRKLGHNPADHDEEWGGPTWIAIEIQEEK